ncbi:short chain dehydrogenase/reductase family oxidoreductase [Isoalcanivorax pacificus W11-5]|uniref:Short chain dehydrogenase/reductase family oxidoreductase n=1 Tax=Isoalcanivorax pacificus W11-5 TaxID=391936 RepID=A0A0B4XS30_9GAMM|nr:SDR family oxidoreductase [Isoalcanivorax pacificus]AJD49575.1 short chain dehydrogenase/reductase family oxidoreductase [Isoalcanivorax pacificus W11-5]
MSAASMAGKTVLITGGNSGIGLVAATALAGMGARVVLACRRSQAAEAAAQQIRAAHPGAGVETVALDLASLESVRRAAREVRERFPVIDVLLNNAGLANVSRETSQDGFELTFATNHLGPFLFTRLLLPAMAPEGRIINVASEAHRMGRMHWDDLQLTDNYWVMRAYAQSKLANILFTRELADQLAGTGIAVSALHPGAVSTSIWPENRWYERAFTRVLKLFLISPEKGARTSIWLASGVEGGKSRGGYFERCKPRQPSARARDKADQTRLWTLSEQLTGLPAFSDKELSA